MAPVPQCPAVDPREPRSDDDEVVISGMSGLYPDSHYLKDLESILYNKENPVTTDRCRWQFNHPEVSNFTGKAPKLDRFDAQFFKVHYRLAICMDTLGRKLMEQAFQAIYDAGLNPLHLSGKKVGVFLGACFSETEKALVYTPHIGSGFGVAGCNRSMFANRISYWLNAKGPSLVVDASDCSGMVAMELAVNAMKRGDCIAALVGSCNVCLHPQSSVHYARIIKMSKDGKTKSFDQNADGCAKSDAFNMVLLQKAKDAKRVYAELLHLKCSFNKPQEDESGPKFGFYRNPDVSVAFMNEFYRHVGVSPSDVAFVEALGSAVPEADKQELEAIERVFCKDRTEPLLVGSIMSNIGYTEAASGISAIIKVLLGYQRGEMAANLHCSSPRQDIAALRDGRMRVATDHTPFDQSAYVAVNSGSVTAIDAHALLRGFHKPKDLNRYKSHIPRLVVLSNRQDEFLQKIFDDLKSRPIDPEEIGLLHHIHEHKVSGHLGRGYILLDTNEEQKTVCISEEVEYYDDTTRPLWFVYSGMGSQWAGMGAQLMRIPVFAAAIERSANMAQVGLWNGLPYEVFSMGYNMEFFKRGLKRFPRYRIGNAQVTPLVFQASIGSGNCLRARGMLVLCCRVVLEPKGIDIVHIITSTEKTIFDSILNSFVGIAAVQIGLTDVLKSIGLKPDKIIGHSTGELGCAYGDGSFTAEETILSAYSRGLVSIQTPFIHGSMAAVGIGFEKITPMLPQEIEVACHNSSESSTISGPSDVMQEFVAKLTAQGIFAKEVPCSNIAYHSRYIKEAGPVLLKHMKEFLPNPKERSERWVSTSVPQDQWGEDYAKYSSAEYHTNNMMNPVLFEEAAKLIPANAVVLEIAPHGLLQAILKRSMPTCKHLPLTRRGHPDNVIMVLETIGKLFIHGYNPDLAALYPPIEFPVSTNTPKLSHFVEWVHQERWLLPLFGKKKEKKTSICRFVKSLHDDEYKYLEGHILKGKNVCPFSAALVAAWDTLAMTQGELRRQLPVEFKDIHFFAQPPIQDHRPLRLRVSLNPGNGAFEVMSEISLVATGFVSKELVDDTRHFEDEMLFDDNKVFDTEDIYKLLHERDHHYEGEFRSMFNANSDFTDAQLIWNNNWVTLLDGLLQLHTLRQPYESLSLASHIRRLVFDSDKMNAAKTVKVEDKILMNAQFSEIHDFTRCGGILIEGARFRNVPSQMKSNVALQNVKFVPHFDATINPSDIWKVFLQMVAENMNKTTLNVMGISNNQKEAAVFDEVRAIIKNAPGVNVTFNQIDSDEIYEFKESFLTKVDLVLVQNLSLDDIMCQMLYRVLQRDAFMINQEETINDRIRPSALYTVMSSHNVGFSKLEFLKWRPTKVTSLSTVVTVRSPSDLEMLRKSRESLPARNKVVILTSYPIEPSLKHLVRQWRKETTQNVYLVSVTEEDNLEQLPEINHVFNVLNKGVWGGDYYLPCAEVVNADHRITLQSAQVGDLNSMYWSEAPPVEKSQLTVSVHYAGFNNLDMKRATGQVSFDGADIRYAMDFSGVTQRGDRVMGLVKNGAASSHVTAIPEFLWPVPKHWTLEDAATVPSAYVQALYILDRLDSMMQSTSNIKSVLISGGCGALGQALISLALGMGCEVFTTVSDVAKKRFLLRLFPKLKEDHIGNSRDTTFVDMVMEKTNGRGVLRVISAGKGEVKEGYFNVCQHVGYVLDVDLLTNHTKFSLNMNHLCNDRTFVSVDFRNLFGDHDAMKRMQLMITEGISLGHVRPLTRVTYGAVDATRAVRLLASSMHRGRVLLRLHQDIPNPMSRITCSPEMCHTVLCADETIGLQLCDRLVHRGARKLLLHIPQSSGYLRYKLRSWEKLGVKVETITEDLNMQGVVNLLTLSNNLGSIEGIYVVTGSFLSLEESDKLSTMLNNLDLTSRRMCPWLRYFAVVGSGHSNARKTCLARSHLGLPATSLDLHELYNQEDILSKKASWRDVIDATERAIRSGQNNLVALTRNQTSKAVMKQIVDLAEIKLSEDKEAVYTVDPAKVPIIGQFLKDVHDTAISEHELTTLTYAKLKEIEEFVTGSVRQEIQGLGNFFAYPRTDELKSSIPVVPVPTLTMGEPEGYDEFDVSKKYLCIIPGLEGHYVRFQALCERLKVGAVMLQPALDHHNDSVRQAAERNVQILRDIINLKDNFYLLGYEAGVAVALETAAILEENGLKGTIFLVGGTPEEFQATLQQQLSSYQTDEELQTAIMRHMLVLMKGDDDGMDEVLEKASTWTERVEACVRLLLGRVQHSAQYARMLIMSAYTRIKQALLYKPQPRKLSSRLVLLHSPSMVCGSNESPAAMLQEYSKEPVVVHELQEPLAYCNLDLRVPSIINQYLEKEILEDYETANLCEDYKIFGDLFRGSKSDDFDEQK